MRTLVDANVVLRYMLHDDKTQSPIAERTIREGAYLLPEVLAEIVYVLLGVYSVPREELAERLQILVKEVQSEHPEILSTASCFIIQIIHLHPLYMTHLLSRRA